MGHVDTGKTKLLDNIRRTNVQDGEAGGITQQIGASFFPNETLTERMGSLVEKKSLKVEVPGLMIIDTPGHESFSNLRSRGSSLCDIAILVIDIMHGLEPQTIESLHMLRSKKTPFVVALNKVDRLYGWQSVKDRPFVEGLELQDEQVQQEFESRAKAVLLALAEQGINAELYWRNKDFREYVSLCPTSAHTGEGVSDIPMMLVQWSQKLLRDRIMFSSEVQHGARDQEHRGARHHRRCHPRQRHAAPRRPHRDVRLRRAGGDARARAAHAAAAARDADQDGLPPPPGGARRPGDQDLRQPPRGRRRRQRAACRTPTCRTTSRC